MTEIQFLAQLLLDETLTSILKKQLIDRIVAVENERNATHINIPSQIFYPSPITYPYGHAITCQHEYPSLWGGTGSPPCMKCGQSMNSGVITTYGTGDIIGSTQINGGAGYVNSVRHGVGCNTGRGSASSNLTLAK